MRTSTMAPWLRQALIAIASLAVATVVVAVLLDGLGIDNASLVYIVAVAVTAVLAGTPGAIGASIGAFVLYDFFFVDPRYTLTIKDPQEWLNVLLLLFVGILVGQLAAIQRQQTQTAREREHEARALFRVSRALATRDSTTAVLARIVDAVVADTAATRAWIETPDAGGIERPVVDTEPGRPRSPSPVVHVLRPTDGDAPAKWTRVHSASKSGGRGGPGDAPGLVVKVLMEAGGRRVGALWALVPREGGLPGPTDTRLLAAVADQVAQALEQDRLVREARDADVARESDRVKTALLETVSHDLRTPLASIRAAAGTLLDRHVDVPPEERYATAETIDRDAERLNRIVTNLLDLSRVEAGALHADLDGYDLADLVETAIDRARPRLGRGVVVELAEVPPVRVDPAFLDQILDNLLENAARYAGRDAPVRVRVNPPDGDRVRLTVEDGGPGVPDAELERVFQKFYRVSRRGPAAKAGSGVGLAVVRGFAEAMGATVSARRSELGGLAVDLDLPVASPASGDAP
jgi:two-component system sensor histidine kinase KdpD